MEGGGYIVFDGVLDISRREEILAAIAGWARSPSVVVNLARVELVDSMILGLLVSFRREFIEYGGDPHNFILIVTKGGGLQRTLEAAGLDRLFAIAYVIAGVSAETA